MYQKPRSAAELFLKGGSSLVGWIIAYVHLLMVAVVRVAQCGEGTSDPWFATLLTAVIAVPAIFMIPMGLFMRPGLRWLALPLVVLALLALVAVLPYIEGTTMAGAAPCGVSGGGTGYVQATGWQRAWAPLQLILIAALGFSASLFWRRTSAPAET